MSMSLDIASLASAYESGALKPEDVIREAYARIKARGKRQVWITLVDEEAALERVRTAPRGPLYGIPFAVKDNIDVAGLPTTCACPSFAYTPDRSAKVVELLGRLRYRTSYSQNVLRHSIEVAFITGMLAEEMGLDGELARRAGLLHDIGKAADHDLEGGHPKIGADLLKRFGEGP